MPDFDRLAAKHGYFLIGLIDQDFDQIYSAKYDMTKIEHFRKSRIYTWYGPLEENMLVSLGATPIPVNVPEISSSSRQGVVDAGIGPAIWQVGSQLHSVWKFINPVKIRYSPALIIQNADDFKGSKEVKEFRDLILDARKTFTMQFVTRVRADNGKCLRAMLRYGLKKSEMSKEDLNEFKKRTRPVWDDMVGKLYSRELLDELLGHLEQYRSR